MDLKTKVIIVLQVTHFTTSLIETIFISRLKFSFEMHLTFSNAFVVS